MNAPATDSLSELLERHIGRRALLRGGVSGALLLAGALLMPAGCRGYPRAPVELKFFSDEEYAVFQAIARAILGLPDDSVDVAAEIDRLVSSMTGTVRRDIHWMLRIFEHGTHLFDLKGKRFTSLARDDQEQYLRGWMESSLGARRMVFRALKLLASLGYYGLPDTWSTIGYDGPWLGRKPVERRFSYEQPAPLARAALPSSPLASARSGPARQLLIRG
ncbi:MAG TPA: hypothetical protein VMR29_02190 [Candidatus Binatia bacterium]|nr:hypothetical protein [Candidatus Binatia bacterium]